MTNDIGKVVAGCVGLLIVPFLALDLLSSSIGRVKTHYERLQNDSDYGAQFQKESQERWEMHSEAYSKCLFFR
jgi:hypothetical protein